MKTKWTEEPWKDNYYTNFPDSTNKVVIDRADYERASRCVNALAGIDNVEGFMDELRLILNLKEKMMQSIENIIESQFRKDKHKMLNSIRNLFDDDLTDLDIVEKTVGLLKDFMQEYPQHNDQV